MSETMRSSGDANFLHLFGELQAIEPNKLWKNHGWPRFWKTNVFEGNGGSVSRVK